jgi:hypothetical protein
MKSKDQSGSEDISADERKLPLKKKYSFQNITRSISQNPYISDLKKKIFSKKYFLHLVLI